MKYILSEAHGIGDCILILPIAKAIKEHDKDAYIRVITRSTAKKIKINEDIFSLQKYVDDIHYYSSEEKIHSIWFLLKNMIKRFDVGISIQDYDTPHTSAYPSLILRFCAKRTCGTRITKNPNVVYDEYIDREPNTKRYVFFRRALAKLGINIKTYNNNLLDKNVVSQYCPQIGLNTCRKTIALVLGTAPVSLHTENGIIKNNAKSWPYKYWLELAGKLSEHFNVILLGGPSEANDLMSYDIPASSCIFNFVGKTKIKESIALLNVADVVVGADTGLMHCAGALDKTSLTLFGCTDAMEYLPFGDKSEYIQSTVECSPCFGTIKSVTCEDKECMKQVSVDMVIMKIGQLLEKYK